MYEKKFTYTLDTKKWFDDLQIVCGEKIIDNKYIYHPTEIAKGHWYWAEIIPGFVILLLDISYIKDVKVIRLPSKDDLFILNYDLSDKVLKFKIAGGNSIKIGRKVNLGFTMIDGNLSSSVKCRAGSNFFGLRLIISKELMNNLTKSDFFSRKKESIYFHDYIDSKSFIHIKDLKEKIVFDDSFKLYLKGIGLELLSNFVERYTINTGEHGEISPNDMKAIKITTKYLLDNLDDHFPGLDALAEMAGISLSKYKVLFKKIYYTTPNKFFMKEKLTKASLLLASGSFNKISDVVYDLNYSTLSYFTQLYLSILKRMPSEDFVKKAG
jgi:AraC-like DNA-binding protein